MKKYLSPFFCLLFCIILSKPAHSYSLLTHQAIVDACWNRNFVPLLRERSPGITEFQLRQAHAYAYGGAIVQDMGYYPLGSEFLTNLLHYVRSGTFVQNLLDDAQTTDEYAFALGALSHYYSDIYGHSLGTNRIMPIMYPKIRKHFGKVSTYEDDPANHTRMEFAIDVLQAANGQYLPEAYRDYIGFKVARPLLERVFLKTYGIKLQDIYVYLPLAEKVFRGTVKALLPEFTKISWHTHRVYIKKHTGKLVKSEYLDSMQTDGFRKEFAQNDKPGPTARILTFFFRALPKLGPATDLKIRIPNTESQELFINSFNVSLNIYCSALRKLIQNVALPLPDINLDTGLPTSIGEYHLADETHRQLMDRLHRHNYRHLTADLQQYLLNYFQALPPPPDYRKEKKEYRNLRRYLDEMQKISVR